MVLASVDGSDGGGGDIGGQAPGNQVPCIYTRSLKKKKKHSGHGRDPAIGSAAVVGRDEATYYLRAEDSELGVFI